MRGGASSGWGSCGGQRGARGTEHRTLHSRLNNNIMIISIGSSGSSGSSGSGSSSGSSGSSGSGSGSCSSGSF